MTSLGIDAPQAEAAVPIGWIAPFVAILLSIAVLPVATPRWWHKNANKGMVAAALAIPVAVWLLANGHGVLLAHACLEFLSFVVLLGSLFAVSGGILIDGDLRATPKVNTAILAIGGVLASLVGTTGASMLLIRPLLRANNRRKHVIHSVVFFIFVVSNCGGCLTPLGDPPLFIGYLRGVPFGWTLSLWPQWLAVNATLLAIYFVWDTLAVRKEAPDSLGQATARVEPLRIRGALSMVLLLGLIACVAFLPRNPWLRDGLMVGLAAVSVALAPKSIRERNGFDWFPIIEVAVLFAGIFVTMLPTLMTLEARGGELPLDTPRQYFWMTGLLSGCLDNAPTYLTFATVASSSLASAHPEAGIVTGDLGTLLRAPGGDELLRAISLGAVFLGALTYIGNGPNFMVKAIAESSGVRMPGFGGYVLYGLGVLVPVLVVVSFVMI